MKKRLLCILLTIVLAVSVFSPVQALADEALADETLSAVSTAELEKANQVITNAISELKGTFPADQAVAISDIFSGISAVNCSVNFLKLIGVIKDSTAVALANITEQLQSISETIAMMDRKLDNISSQMSKMQASAEFNARTEKSLLLEQNWADFQYRYEEDGMDELMTEYHAALLNGLQRWCRGVTKEGQTIREARTIDGVDNSRIILIYTDNGSGYEPYYYAGDSVPADLPSGARWLVLSEKVLPEKVEWKGNTYRADIKKSIADRICEIVSAGDFDVFECGNFDEFTEKGSAALTPELIDQIAEDAVNALAYRIAYAYINVDSFFTLQVKRQYLNYCTHLLAVDNGIDAVIKTFYLTHAFEFEISQDLLDFCNEIAVKAGTYGTFASNILGLSIYATDADQNDVLSAYCSTLNTIGEAKNNSLTGRKQYCYITNTELYLGELDFSATAVIETKEDNAVSTFRSGKGNPMTVKLSGSWDRSFTPDRNSMIGDTNMILLAYTMQSGSNPMTFDYLKKNLSDSYISDYGAFVSSFGTEESLPLDSAAPLKVTKVFGNYFTNGAFTSLENPPSSVKEKKSNFFHRSMISGSVFNPSSFTTENQVLSGMAIYGENHWYWLLDEVAILGGNPNQKSFNAYFNRTRQSYQYYFTYDYHQYVGYNCLVCKALPERLTDVGEYDPLKNYLDLCKELNNSDDPERSAFADVLPTDPFFSAVNCAAEKGIVNGYDDGLFHPDYDCARAQMLTILWRAANRPASDAKCPFNDVDAGGYYYDAIRWAYANGIALGTGADTFSPNESVTREQAATFIYRLAQKLGAGFTGGWSFPLEYADAGSVSDWADEAVHWCVMKNILPSDGSDLLKPQEKASRAEVVMMIMAFCDMAQTA